jgi:hypothetical protein
MPSIYYSDIRTQFSKVCPNSSLPGQDPTIEKQNKILDPPGITIVGHIIEHEEIPFNYAVFIICKSLYCNCCNITHVDKANLTIFCGEID